MNGTRYIDGMAVAALRERSAGSKPCKFVHSSKPREFVPGFQRTWFYSSPPPTETQHTTPHPLSRDSSMSIYRAYRQPGMPPMGGIRPARTDHDDDDDGYSNDIKDMCFAAAGPPPPYPTACLTKDCRVLKFFSRVSFKEDYAAAYVMVVSLSGVPCHCFIADRGTVSWLSLSLVP